jgi:hypothetical protein
MESASYPPAAPGETGQRLTVQEVEDQIDQFLDLQKVEGQVIDYDLVKIVQEEESENHEGSNDVTSSEQIDSSHTPQTQVSQVKFQRLMDFKICLRFSQPLLVGPSLAVEAQSCTTKTQVDQVKLQRITNFRICLRSSQVSPVTPTPAAEIGLLVADNSPIIEKVSQFGFPKVDLVLKIESVFPVSGSILI